MYIYRINIYFVQFAGASLNPPVQAHTLVYALRTSSLSVILRMAAVGWPNSSSARKPTEINSLAYPTTWHQRIQSYIKHFNQHIHCVCEGLTSLLHYHGTLNALIMVHDLQQAIHIRNLQTLITNATEGVSAHSGVGQLNPCHRGRDVIGGVSSCFRRVSSVLIATASRGVQHTNRALWSVARKQHHYLISRGV